jgi:hypothetical protein
MLSNQANIQKNHSVSLHYTEYQEGPPRINSDFFIQGRKANC